MLALKIDSGRRSVEVVKQGEVSRWEYDVITVKLEAEKLEKQFELRKEGSNQLGPPTPEFLQAFASKLDSDGLSGCTVDAAYQVYQIVNAQFTAMAFAVQSQVNDLLA